MVIHPLDGCDFVDHIFKGVSAAPAVDLSGGNILVAFPHYVMEEQIQTAIALQDEIAPHTTTAIGLALVDSFAVKLHPNLQYQAVDGFGVGGEGFDGCCDVLVKQIAGLKTADSLQNAIDAFF